MQRLRLLISVPVVIDVAGETWKQGNEGIKKEIDGELEPENPIKLSLSVS